MTHPDYADAERHLAAAHPAFAKLIEEVGPCTLVPDGNRFAVLVRMLISQLISTQAAKAIHGRLMEMIAPQPMSAAALAAHTDDEIDARGAKGKRKFLRALQEAVLGEGDYFGRVESLPRDEMAKELRKIPGVGPWTVDMYRIFALGDLDVLATGDLGVRTGAKEQCGLDEVPKPAELTKLAEPWRPYRTVATWYLWKSRGFVPQSE